MSIPDLIWKFSQGSYSRKDIKVCTGYETRPSKQSLEAALCCVLAVCCRHFFFCIWVVLLPPPPLSPPSPPPFFVCVWETYFLYKKLIGFGGPFPIGGWTGKGVGDGPQFLSLPAPEHMHGLRAACPRELLLDVSLLEKCRVELELGQ